MLNKRGKPARKAADKTKLSSSFMENSVLVRKAGQQSSIPRGMPQVKFVDVGQTVSATSVGAILSGLTPITQGVGVSQRTGDTVFWKKFFLNYTVSTQNADIFNVFRLILFQWHPNSALVAPTVADILQTASCYSMYDWQFSSQYKIMYDRVHLMSGIAGAPTSAGFQGYFGEIPHSGPSRADFSAGTAFGAEQFFILVISDSLLVPFPSVNVQTRVTYSEE